MLANVIAVGLSLLRTPAITWFLPKDQVGMLGVVSAWIPFISLLSLPGLNAASYHYVAKGDSWAFPLNVTNRLRLSLLSSAACLASAAYWWFRGNHELALLFVIAGVSFPLTIGLSACSGTLAAQEDFTNLFWYRLAGSMSAFAGFLPLLLSVWWLSQVLAFYSVNQLVTDMLQIGVTWWLLRRIQKSVSTPPRREEQKAMVGYGKHQTAIGSIGILQSRADVLLIGTFLPLSTMADYSIAILAQSQLKQLWIIYQSVRYPALVRRPTHLRRRRLVWEGLLALFGFAMAGIAVAILAYWLVPLIFPASYAGSVAYINWLILAFVISVPGYLVEVYFRTEQEEKPQYLLRSVAALAGVVLPAGLMLRWGIQGVLVGRTIAAVTFSALGVWLFVASGRKIA
jgi:O-antigen/teichoic acid export membrane protein